MKNVLTIVLMIYICVSPLLCRAEAGRSLIDFPEVLNDSFILTDVSALRVSVESGWEHDGRVPLVLTFASLEVHRHVAAADLKAVEGLEAGVSRVLTEENDLPFATYENNRLRTRMILEANNKPVKLVIDRETGRVEFFIGSRPLELGCICVKCKENTPGRGLHEIFFTGQEVHCHGARFVFDPARGIIYMMPHGNVIYPVPKFDKDNGWFEWAVRFDRQVAGEIVSWER